MKQNSRSLDTIMEDKTRYFPCMKQIRQAAVTLKGVAAVTPLQYNANVSRCHEADVFLKREDLQQVRSYKIRGAFNKMHSLNALERSKGIVCASAGNHAQGVAYSCKKLGIHGIIYMPKPTPRQKIEQVQMFGGAWVTIVLEGDTFDDAKKAAKSTGVAEGKVFIPPFDDEKVIEGQATVGLEIVSQEQDIDYVFVPVGGGGLAAGLATVFKTLSPKTKIIGVEPAGAPSMSTSFKNGKNTTLSSIEKFVDGAAVQRVGDLTYPICNQFLDGMLTVPEGKVCQTILKLYSKDAIVVEPAGALTLAALDLFEGELTNKKIVCIVSGSNNDIARTQEIKERALLYENLKHYFIVRFPQRAGALKEFVAEVLGPTDDITHFEYSKKHAREQGPAVVGVELKNSSDLAPLIHRMKARDFFGEYLNEKPDLFQFLV